MLLKETMTINGMTIKNRLVMAPVASEKATLEGRVTDDHIDFYGQLSSLGQVGLFILEHSYVSAEGKASPRQISVADDESISGLKRIVDVIHDNGGKVILQISHAGSATNKEITGYDAIGPSAVANPRKGGMPNEMSISDIETIVTKFADAALRAKLAGFDGAEIHSAHGYFLNQFLSPLSNKRDDGYGGSLENRIRIHTDIIKAVRAKVGSDFALFLRIGASDYEPSGTTIEDSIGASKIFEALGLDAIDVSGGFCGYTGNGATGQGYFKALTKPLKEALSIPVMLTGGITEVSSAEILLAEGFADLIGVARALTRDHNWGSELK